MSTVFDRIPAALADLQRVAPPTSGGVYEVENMGGGLYCLGVRTGDTFTPSTLVARPARMVRTLRALADVA